MITLALAQEIGDCYQQARAYPGVAVAYLARAALFRQNGTDGGPSIVTAILASPKPPRSDLVLTLGQSPWWGRRVPRAG
jgi:hypothetical protein